MKETPGNNFLGEKYNQLYTSKEVNRAVQTSEKQPQKKNERIEAYLDRIERIMHTERPGEKTGADLLEHLITEDFVLDLSDEETTRQLAADLYQSEKEIAKQRGQGADIEELDDEEVLARYESLIEEKRDIQKESLKPWLTYLKENDADYPVWFQYFTLRSLKGMGKFDRDEKRYHTRTEDTLAPFPEFNAETYAFVYKALTEQIALEHISLTPEEEAQIQEATLTDEEIQHIKSQAPEAYWEDAIAGARKKKRAEKRKALIQERQEEKRQAFFDQQPFDEEDKEALSEELTQRLEAKDFAKLYAFAQVETAGSMERITTEGEWKHYPQGSDCTVLEADLRGKGTGWCTAEGTAADQLQSGDFFVYYTYNNAGEPTEPRIAVRQEDGKVAEVRGVDEQQELEPELIDIAQEKYHDMPGAEQYEQAEHDMKYLTTLYNRAFTEDPDTGETHYQDPTFSKDDLRFLYEIDREIASFGYQKDPRIEEIKTHRDKKEDLTVVFDCDPKQISLSKEEALSGNIICHGGNLELKELTSAEGLTLPEYINGELDFENLTSAEGLTFPKHVGENLDLFSLTSAEGLTLPEHVGGYLDFFNLPEQEKEKLRQQYPQFADKI